MKYENKGRKSKLFIGSILALSMIMNATGFTYAKRYDKENFPISQTRDDFPESYKPYIEALKAKHPNWVFKAVYTGLDWNEVITHETYDVSDKISLVPDKYGPEWKKDGKNYYQDGYFVTASKEAVKYMIDPRNHLTEEEVFQFETLNYSSTAHNQEAIEKVLYGTSMYQRSEYKKAGNMVAMNKTYSQIILEKAQKYNVSATHIASRIKQETGGDIIYNQSINGSYPGLEGLYNFFNIGASANGDGNGAIANGLSYASGKGWTTPEASIDGGVDALRNNWIKWGQNTTYFQKWDVNNEGNALVLYGSQYMQNIIAPTSESIMTKRAYEKAGLLNETYEFKIPVFNNMPTHVAPYPGNPEIPEDNYVDDNTRIAVDSSTGLNVRTGPGTNFSVITALTNGTQMTRIAKSMNTQWDKVRLDNGMEGYVFRDGTRDIDTYVKVDNVKLNVTEKRMKSGEELKLEASIEPQTANNKEVEYTSDNPNVATVDGNGKVIAKNGGEAIITVKTKDQGKTATCKITVDFSVENITLPKSEYKVIKGESVELLPTISPENAVNKEYTVEIKDTNIAEYKDGKIVAKNVGNTTITFKTVDGGKTVTANISVVEIKDNEIHIDNSLTYNETTNTVSKINPGTKLADIKDKFVSKLNITLKDKDGKELNDDSLVGTGTKVIATNADGKIIHEYNIIIYGDVNGDGAITSKDYMSIKNHIMETSLLEGVYFKSANLNGDNEISSKDYMVVKNHIMEINFIEQK
ncbi:MAG: Ig-like domain-containing protein [Clostridia bacterium]|nr:Ig-like domain-containing protein [Clostridia bacterium]